jgi:hypothetical protein
MQMIDMKEIGKKSNQNPGYLFYPYIRILEIKLPVKFSHMDKLGNPVFKKNSF